MSVRGTHVPEHLRLPIAGVTPPPTEKEGQRLFPTGNFRFYRPVYRDKTPPCNHACPTGEQIQKYLDHVKHDRYLDGYLTILEDNPMPAVTGRVCYHPCETACNRAAHDEPIGIRGVERFLGDFGLKLADNPVKPALPPLNGKTVAIVGSGPGGLGCAYHLRRTGYASVIFEALDQPGGMLRAGIPAWHLPGEILDAEIAKLLDLGGIEIRCGVRVGDDPDGVTLDYLRTTYDAVFLALGQDVGRRLGAEGAQARGVIGAMEFLRETGLGRPVTVGASVLVIGGGNTASDAARSAIRLGGGRTGHDRLPGGRGRAAHPARGPGPGPGRGRALPAADRPGQRADRRGRQRSRRRAGRRPPGQGRERRGQAADHRGHRVRGAVRHDPGRDRAGAGARLAPRALHRATGWSRPTNSAACRTRRPRCSRAAT